jgi:hypothetical protein|eukprot:COSAG06_NODE_5257_length_3605_cov_2.802624_3_plen_47_part_00
MAVPAAEVVPLKTEDAALKHILEEGNEDEDDMGEYIKSMVRVASSL